jgi:hypothetical protein
LESLRSPAFDLVHALEAALEPVAGGVQVDAPDPGALDSGQGDGLLEMLFEAFEPDGDGAGVVGGEALDVLDGEAGPEGLEILVIGAPNLGENTRDDVEGERDWWAD